MPASFPTSAKSWTPLVDGVDAAAADDINTVYLEVTAVENKLLDGVTLIEEASGPTTLEVGSIADGQILKRSGTDIIGTASNITFFDDGTERCLAVKYINKTGGASVKGKLVKAGSGTSSVILTANDDDMPIGVMLEDGVADGTATWIAVAGLAYVQYQENTGATLGHVVYCGTAGRATSAATVPAAATHDREVGHCMQTVAATGAGTYINSLTNLHFR